MPPRSRRLAALALALLAAGCDGPAAPPPPPDPDAPIVYESGVRFRTRGDRFEVSGPGGTWRSFFPKGVNLGTAKPGREPGELAATREDYARWLEHAGELGANEVRLYTLHPPAFYEAFGEHQRAHPDRPLYLVQGVWVDELEAGDYVTHSVVDALPRLAYADGTFDAARVPVLAWDGWNRVETVERRKPAFHALAEAYRLLP